MLVLVVLGFLALLCLYGEFFVPGGILAVFAVLFCIAGLVGMFWQMGFLAGLLYLVFLVVGAIFTVQLALKTITRRTLSDFCLKEDQEGFVSSSLEKDLMVRVGFSSTELRPSGYVCIEEKNYQAISIGEFIPKGASVEVVAIRGSYLVVKKKT